MPTTEIFERPVIVRTNTPPAGSFEIFVYVLFLKSFHTMIENFMSRVFCGVDTQDSLHFYAHIVPYPGKDVSEARNKIAAVCNEINDQLSTITSAYFHPTITEYLPHILMEYNDCLYKLLGGNVCQLGQKVQLAVTHEKRITTTTGLFNKTVRQQTFRTTEDALYTQYPKS